MDEIFDDKGLKFSISTKFMESNFEDRVSEGKIPSTINFSPWTLL